MIKERFRYKERKIAIDDIRPFAEAHFHASKEGRWWNGRQIRNACQTALALAEFEAQGSSHMAIINPDALVHLRLSHFETVQKAYRDFDDYLSKIYGTSTETRAQEGKIRAILNMIDESPNGAATGGGFARSRKEAFRNAARAKVEPPQQPVTPMTQPAVPQPQTTSPAQPALPHMYAAGAPQYPYPGLSPQGYLYNPIYPQYAQQPIGMQPVQQQQPQQQQQQQQQQAAQYQPIQFMPQQPQMNQPQTLMPQSTYTIGNNLSSTLSSVAPNPEGNSGNAQQSRTLPDMSMSPPVPQQHLAQPLNYPAGSQYTYQPQSGSSTAGGGPPPLPGSSGATGSVYPAGPPPGHGFPPQ